MINRYYVEEDIPEKFTFDESTTFKEYSAYWLAFQEMSLSPKTYARYIKLLERIDLGIGHISLGKLSSYHIIEFERHLAEEGTNIKTGGSLSPKTILHHHRLISVILQSAVRKQIIPFNPASRDHMKSPRVPFHEAEMLQLDDVKSMIAELDKEDIRKKTAIYLALFVGLRREEICGLEWQDISLKKRFINVSRASIYVSGKGVITKEPKSIHSVRTVPINENIMVKQLERYRDYYIENISKDKNLQGKRLFVQKNDPKKQIHPDTISGWIKKFGTKNNINITTHMLRHTYVSLHIAQGTPLKKIQEAVGHSALSTTCNIYAHAIQQRDLQHFDSLEGMLELDEGT